MKIWAQIHKGERIIKSYLYTVPEKFNLLHFENYLTDICSELDLPRPLTLKKHTRHFNNFNTTTYKPIDFVESVDLDKFVLEAVSDD